MCENNYDIYINELNIYDRLINTDTTLKNMLNSCKLKYSIQNKILNKKIKELDECKIPETMLLEKNIEKKNLEIYKIIDILNVKYLVTDKKEHLCGNLYGWNYGKFNPNPTEGELKKEELSGKTTLIDQPFTNKEINMIINKNVKNEDITPTRILIKMDRTINYNYNFS